MTRTEKVTDPVRVSWSTVLYRAKADNCPVPLPRRGEAKQAQQRLIAGPGELGPLLGSRMKPHPSRLMVSEHGHTAPCQEHQGWQDLLGSTIRACRWTMWDLDACGCVRYGTLLAWCSCRCTCKCPFVSCGGSWKPDGMLHYHFGPSGLGSAPVMSSTPAPGSGAQASRIQLAPVFSSIFISSFSCCQGCGRESKVLRSCHSIASLTNVGSSQDRRLPDTVINSLHY